MKKTLLLSILFISAIIISNCGKGVITGPSSNKSTATNENQYSPLTRDELLSEIQNIGDLYFHNIGYQNKLILASFANVKYNEENTNQMLLSLEKGPDFTPTQFSANKDINVEDALYIINKKIVEVRENITNSAISNISFSIDTDNLNTQILTLKLNIQLHENAETTDIDTNDISLKLDLGYLRYNQRPSALWWWRSNIRN